MLICLFFYKSSEVIVEFVKKYYREQGLSLPSSFFNTGFVGELKEGAIADLAEAVDDRSKQRTSVKYLVGGPLLLALYFGHKDVAQYLINEGALGDAPQCTKYGLFPGDGYLPVAFYNGVSFQDGSGVRKSYTVDLAKYAREAGLNVPTSI